MHARQLLRCLEMAINVHDLEKEEEEIPFEVVQQLAVQAHDQRAHDQRVHDQRAHDQQVQDQRVRDQQVHDQQVRDQRVHDPMADLMEELVVPTE